MSGPRCYPWVKLVNVLVAASMLFTLPAGSFGCTPALTPPHARAAAPSAPSGEPRPAGPPLRVRESQPRPATPALPSRPAPARAGVALGAPALCAAAGAGTGHG